MGQTTEKTMPLFEYVCSKCGAVTELLVRRPSDEDSAACQQCGSKKVAKKLSAHAVAVKAGKGELPCGQETTCCGRSSPCGTRACPM